MAQGNNPMSGMTTLHPHLRHHDLSEQDIKNIEDRRKLRVALKKEWRRRYADPNKFENGNIFDPALQRWMSMRVTLYDHFKPSPKNFAIAMSVSLIPISIAAMILLKERGVYQHKLRTGQVSYADRNWKYH